MSPLGSFSNRLVLYLLPVAASLSVACAQEKTDPADEPATREFLSRVAQEYYDALIVHDFNRTATREVFAVQDTPPDVPAYRKAMETHPYASAKKITVLMADLDDSRAYVDLTITRTGGTETNRMTWSRTGVPKKWVVAMTQMTLAGMPGFQVFTGEGEAQEKKDAPRVTVESKVVFKERNQQDGRVVGATNSSVRFVRSPKVMPATKLGHAAYVLGMIENIGTQPVTGLAVKAVVRSEGGEIVETREFRPSVSALEPGKEIKFDGLLDHLDPKRTEFTLTWEP